MAPLPAARPVAAAAAVARPATAASSALPAPRPPAANPVAATPAAASIDKTPLAPTARERADIDYRRALALLDRGRGDEAAGALRAALAIDAQHTSARQLLLRLLLDARRSDEAVDLLQEGLQLQPAQTGWAMALARLQVERSDWAGAWQTLQRSQPATGGGADYAGFAGHVLLRLGRAHDAVEQYRGAVRASPGEGRWWLGLGLALEADAQAAAAREALLRARASGTLTPELAALVEQKLR